jgi:aminoacyl tRNA synthase complex-interacting multifunctional protein 1
LRAAEYYGIPAVTRYFDHVQSAPAIRSSAASLGDSYSVISFDLQDAPRLERNPEAGKKKDKSVKTTAAQHAETVAETYIRTSADKQPQKEKGKKKEKVDAATSSNAVATKKQGTAPTDDNGEPVPSMIDLRVGHIVDSKVCFHAYI